MAIISGLSLAAVLGYLAAGAGAIGAGGVAGRLLDEIIKEAEKQKWLNKKEVDEVADEKKNWFEASGSESNLFEKEPRTDSSGAILNAKHGESDKAAMDKWLNEEGLFKFDETGTGGTPTEENKDKTPIGPGITGGFGGSEQSGSSEQSGAIKDGTDENTGTTTITPMDWVAKIEEWRENDRAREDQIRAETQAREDTAWQRGIEDLRKSGANINLMAAQPAESGGGITSATGVNTSALTNNMNNEIKEMLQILEQDFKGSENDKDRYMTAFSNLMSFVGILIAIAGRK